MSGCSTCDHAFFSGGDIQCRKRPHDYQTREQRAIVRWLQVAVDPMKDPDCPGYERALELGPATQRHGTDEGTKR